MLSFLKGLWGCIVTAAEAVVVKVRGFFVPPAPAAEQVIDMVVNRFNPFQGLAGFGTAFGCGPYIIGAAVCCSASIAIFGVIKLCRFPGQTQWVQKILRILYRWWDANFVSWMTRAFFIMLSTPGG
ncbi:MAG TPA: hypothetical protein GXX25_09445 [Desulfotomaculum sp.]|nr:hypothetical protein [Desulfotomaculum sp.]